MMTPEMRAKLQTFKALKVKHPRLEEVDHAVRRAIYQHASYSQLILLRGKWSGQIDYRQAYHGVLYGSRAKPGHCPCCVRRSSLFGYWSLRSLGLL